MQYGQSYYASSCSLTGTVPYTRQEPQWSAFFGTIAQHIINDLGALRVLDAGCAIGFLVEELRRRGVDASGFDISEFAIEQVPAELRPYVQVGNITNPGLLADQRFDLVTCIEVVEHLRPDQADAAITNLCRWGNTVLFSSTPEDFNEPTHLNVQRPAYWVRKFAAHGFYLDADYQAAFITPWAMLFRRGTPDLSEVMAASADRIYELQCQVQHLQSGAAPAPAPLESLALTWKPTRREALDMRWAQLRRRAQLLRRTAAVTLQQHGLWELIKRSGRWMRGERGYWQNLSRSQVPANHDLGHEELYEPYNPASGEFLRYRFAESDYALHARLYEPNEDTLQVQKSEVLSWPNRPLLSIITPVYNPPISVLRELIFSLQAQTYDHWEWIAADGSTDPAVWALLTEAGAQDSRIKAVRLERNEGISGNTNATFRHATGEFVVLLDHDDTLAAQALYRIARAIADHPGVDFIYSDEDKLNHFNRRCEPFYKPDWSPEMLLSGNYLIHVAAFRRSLLTKVGLMNPATDGAQDWDFFLRISEVTDAFVHIPEVLYHWRKSDVSTASSHMNKPYVQVAQLRAIQQHLQRLGLKNPVTRFFPDHLIYSVSPVSQWELAQPPRISIIIPTKDRGKLLKKCLGALLKQATYPNFEVILVDSGSTEKAALEFYAQIERDSRVRIVPYRAETFNFSQACNQGAVLATGSLLLFLNNDVEVLQRDWLQRLAQWFELPQVGIVGPKLLFPSGEIQHAGVVLGLTGLAVHIFVGSQENISSIFGSDSWYRNTLAVTGACLMIRRALFEELGGFDQAYRMDFSDVALCVRAHARGWRTVYTPTVRLIHHESASRSLTRYRSDFERAGEEFRTILEYGDPYYNRNYSALYNYPTLKLKEPAAVDLHRAMMAQAPPGETISVTSLIFAHPDEPVPDTAG